MIKSVKYFKKIRYETKIQGMWFNFIPEEDCLEDIKLLFSSKINI